MDTATRMLVLINGYWASQVIHVAARLRLPDHLAGGPLTVAELATVASCDQSALRRLTRALVAVDVLADDDDGRIALTPLGAELCSDAQRKLGDWAEFVGRPSVWQAWGALEHSVRSGDTAFVAVNGRDVWQFRSENPEEGLIFDAAMTAISDGTAEAMLAAYDFSAASRRSWTSAVGTAVCSRRC